MAARDGVIREIELRLGGQMIDVELDPEHYHLSVDKALERFRQRSENAPEESLMVLPLLPDVQEYTLPNEVIEIKRLSSVIIPSCTLPSMLLKRGNLRPQLQFFAVNTAKSPVLYRIKGMA